MPQLTSLVLTDRKATPVNHTYLPREIQGNVATVVESSGTPIGDNRVTVSLTRTANGRYKPTIKFAWPVVQNATINGVTVPTVVRTAYAELNFNFDQTSTLEERNDIVGMVQNSLTATRTLINDVVVKLEGVY